MEQHPGRDQVDINQFRGGLRLGRPSGTEQRIAADRIIAQIARKPDGSSAMSRTRPSNRRFGAESSAGRRAISPVGYQTNG